MALVDFFQNFRTLWAETGPTDTVEDTQYRQGWGYIGSNPPSVEQFNKVQQLTDQKAAWLFEQFRTLSTLTGQPLTATSTDALSYALQNLDAGNIKNGVLPVARGGTGRSGLANNTFIVGAGAGNPVQQLTAAQAMALLGAAPLASPEFTGAPRSTTPPRGDVSKRIATTEHIAAGYVEKDSDGNAVSPVFLRAPTFPAVSVSSNDSGATTRQVMQLAAAVPVIGGENPARYLIFSLRPSANLFVSLDLAGFNNTSSLGTLLSASLGFCYMHGSQSFARPALSHSGTYRPNVGLGFDAAGNICVVIDRAGSSWPTIGIPRATLSHTGASGVTLNTGWQAREAAAVADITGLSWLPDNGLHGELAHFPRAYSILNLPTSNVGPIIVIEAAEVWTWVSTDYFTGYRSPLCGRPVDGHTLSPLASEVDAVGGLLSKTAYAGLWGYAQENGLVVTQATWTANPGAHWFVDVSSTQFRAPDLRNQFRRFAGTDADTANARVMGGRQLDATQRVTGAIVDLVTNVSRAAGGAFTIGDIGPIPEGTLGTGFRANRFDFDSSRVARTATETRPVNVAYAPRIHV